MLTALTTSTTTSPDPIGVMPNLQRAFTSFLWPLIVGGTPSPLLIRDSITDTGPPIGGDNLYASPDIITKNAAVPDPQKSFGAGSGVEHSDALNDLIVEGSDTFLYLRALNSSARELTDVVGTVFIRRRQLW